MKQGALAYHYAGNVLLVHVRDDLERARLADPEEHFGRVSYLANLAILPQDDAVQRRAQDIRLEPGFLCRDQRLDPRLLALGPLKFLQGSDVAGGEVAESCQIAHRKALAGDELPKDSLGLAVVETRQHVARSDPAALAIAELDNPLAE